VGTGPKFENKTLWSYTNQVKSDKAFLEDQISAKPMTLEERIEKKLQEYGVNVEELIPKQLEKEETKKTNEIQPIQKANAKHHYDKEDLISFH
jgi:hypothetical protein